MQRRPPWVSSALPLFLTGFFLALAVPPTGHTAERPKAGRAKKASSFIGLEPRLDAAFRDAPRLVALSPFSADRAAGSQRFNVLASRLASLKLTDEEIRDVVKAYIEERRRHKNMSFLEEARVSFISGAFEDSRDLALRAGDDAHRAKPRDASAVVSCLELAGYAAMELGLNEDARKYLTVAETETHSDKNLPEWARIQTALAQVDFRRGDYTGQQRILRAVFDQHVRALGPGHVETLRYHNELAAALYDQRQDALAQEEYVAILAELEKAPEANTAALISVSKNLATVLEGMGQFLPAEPFRRKVVELQKKVPVARHLDTFLSRLKVIESLQKQGRLVPAIEEMEAVLADVETIRDADPVMLEMSLRFLGSLRYDERSYGKSAPLFQRLYDLLYRRKGPTDLETLAAATMLADNLSHLGESERARTLLEQTLARGAKAGLAEGPDMVTTMHCLALVQQRLGKYAAAEQELRRVHELRARTYGQADVNTLQALFSLADLFAARGDHDLAVQAYLEVLGSLQRYHGPKHPMFMACRTHLAELLEKMGRYREAEEHFTAVLIPQLKVLTPDACRLAAKVAVAKMKQGKYAEAVPLFNLALRGIPEIHPSQYTEEMEGFRRVMGECLVRVGNDWQGKMEINAAMRNFTRLYGLMHPGVLACVRSMEATKTLRAEREAQVRALNENQLQSTLQQVLDRAASSGAAAGQGGAASPALQTISRPVEFAPASLPGLVPGN